MQVYGKCMDITGANYSNGTLIELWPCNGGANQQWQASNGELVNPASGKCLDDPELQHRQRDPARPVDLQRRQPTSNGTCPRRSPPDPGGQPPQCKRRLAIRPSHISNEP